MNKKALSLQQKAVISEQKALASEQKAVISEQKALTSEQKAVISEQKALASEQKAVISEQKALIPERKALTSEQKAVISEQKALTSEQKALASEQKDSISEKGGEGESQKNFLAKGFFLSTRVLSQNKRGRKRGLHIEKKIRTYYNVPMKKRALEYRQDVAFINREKELAYLESFINKRPAEILFIHGPKSSGKTTLLYKFFGQIQEEQKLDVKFMDLRKTFTNVYEDFLKAFFHVEAGGEKKEKLASNINIGFFKIDASVEKKIFEKRADPFRVMEAEFLRLTRKGIKPVLIIDELQALDKVYLDNGKDRQLITALFNFFVAMTKQSHLAHIMIASSDGYFLNTVYNDSKLKKCSKFFKVDYLSKEDVMEWLLNLEKYSKIKDYTITRDDAEKIWDVVGGSMWEIQDILTELFELPIDEVLGLYKKKIKGMIEYYIGMDLRKEKILATFLKKDTARMKDFNPKGIEVDELEGLLQDMVRNNILYFDPTEAIFCPQGKSYQWGVQLYFEQ